MKSQASSILVGVLLAWLSLTLAACACASAPDPPAAYNPNYSYKAPTSEAGKGISIAIIRPISGLVGEQYKDEPVVENTQRAIEKSMLDYLTASGFTVSGPYRSIDDMTFPEKNKQI